MLKYWKMSSCDQHQTELVGLSLPVWHHCPDEECCLHLGFNLIFLFAEVVLSQVLPDLIMNLLCRKRRTSVKWTDVEKLNWELNWIKNTAAVTGSPGLLHSRRQRQLNSLRLETCRVAAPHTFLDCVFQMKLSQDKYHASSKSMIHPCLKDEKHGTGKCMDFYSNLLNRL